MRPVTITLDRKRTLSFGLNAMAALEEAGIEIATEEDLKRPTVLRAVLWAGLLDDDPTLTIFEAGALISLNKIPELGKAIAEAFDAAQPPPAEKKARPPKARR